MLCFVKHKHFIVKSYIVMNCILNNNLWLLNYQISTNENIYFIKTKKRMETFFRSAIAFTKGKPMDIDPFMFFAQFAIENTTIVRTRANTSWYKYYVFHIHTTITFYFQPSNRPFKRDFVINPEWASESNKMKRNLSMQQSTKGPKGFKYSSK